MLTRRPGLARGVALLALAASLVACADVLGLQAGVPEDDASTGAASGDDGPFVDGWDARPEAQAPSDGAGAADETSVASGLDASEEAPDGPVDAAAQDAAEAEPPIDANAAPDATAEAAPDGGGCGAPLQPCTTGSDCCSGTCGLTLACL